jgi:hypothetical protein
VAFREKGRPVQAVTILTTCEGAGGKVLTFKLTSFEARTQVPVGKVVCCANAFNLAP